MQSCCICLKSFYPTDIRTSKRCKHDFCCNCLVEYFKDFTINKIKCMKEECTMNLPDSIIRECLSNAQIDIYERVLIISSSQKAIKCLTANCFYIALCDHEDIVFECAFCKSPNCTRCKKRHYPNECKVKRRNEDAIESRGQMALMLKKRSEFKELEKTYSLIPNPESFICSICENLILPRVGVILRNCLHCFCIACLTSALTTKKFISQMTCLMEKCCIALASCEILVIFNENKWTKMMIKEASSRFYQCKNGDCVGMWDVTMMTRSYQCPVCDRINCMDCKDIHEEMSCKEFRRTAQYISVQNQYEILDQKAHVKCYLCWHILIRKDGCSAMYCNNCGNQTCLFTGKIPGYHDPQKCYCGGAPDCVKIKSYCGCTPIKPCHKNCLYGCFPENHE